VSENLYEDMAQAMRDRQTALNGVIRWQAKLREAEANVESIGAKLAANAGTVTPLMDTPFTNTVVEGFGSAETGASFEQGAPVAGIAQDYSLSAE
jgi:hypothetical protein